MCSLGKGYGFHIREILLLLKLVPLLHVSDGRHNQVVLPRLNDGREYLKLL